MVWLRRDLKVTHVEQTTDAGCYLNMYGKYRRSASAYVKIFYHDQPPLPWQRNLRQKQL